jgi:hypothetical protein
MKKKRHVLSKSDNREPLHLSEELVDLLYDYSMCGLEARSSASHTTHDRHPNNATTGHDFLVDPRHDRHGDTLQLLLPGLIFLCFDIQIVLEPFDDGGVDLGLALSTVFHRDSKTLPVPAS